MPKPSTMWPVDLGSPIIWTDNGSESSYKTFLFRMSQRLQDRADFPNCLVSDLSTSSLPCVNTRICIVRDNS